MRMAQPLEGVTVLDLTQIYNGPYATFLMAMAGANVIKIEPPSGEHLRKRQGVSGAAMPFAMLNANKRTMTLNLKTARGRALLLELAVGADVLIENFAPGVLDRLGVGADRLHQANPRLIYASGSGFGLTGPYRDYPAMDLTVQAIAGVIDTTGYADRPPVKAGPAVADFLAGVHLFGAVSAALYERERTGKGRSIEVSMMESIYPTLASSLGLFYGSGGGAAPRTGNRHTGMSLSPYNVYPTSDGYIAIITNNETHWLNLVDALGHPEMARDPRFLTLADRCKHMDAVDAELGAVTLQRTKAALFELLIARRVPCAPVRTLLEVVDDPHLHERGSLQWIDHPEYGRIVVPASPLRFGGSPAQKYKPSSPLGADTRAILAERLHLDAAALDALAADGII
jgi:CoA:oxalate CoA-transferase